MAGQRMALGVGGKRVLEDLLQGDGAHRRCSEGGALCARVPHGMGQRIRTCLPRCKRLVQRQVSAAPDGRSTCLRCTLPASGASGCSTERRRPRPLRAPAPPRPAVRPPAARVRASRPCARQQRVCLTPVRPWLAPPRSQPTRGRAVERWRSPAAGSRSEVRAEAGGSQVQRCVSQPCRNGITLLAPCPRG